MKSSGEQEDISGFVTQSEGTEERPPKYLEEVSLRESDPQPSQKKKTIFACPCLNVLSETSKASCNFRAFLPHMSEMEVASSPSGRPWPSDHERNHQTLARETEPASPSPTPAPKPLHLELIRGLYPPTEPG